MIEREQELLYSASEPIRHIYTSPIETILLFESQEDILIAITYLAITAVNHNVEILAYAFMSNHIHLIVRGENYKAFFAEFRSFLSSHFSRHGRPGIARAMVASAKMINDLRQFRTEIAYVLRNPYVVREDINPLACELTSAFLYFNPYLKYLPAKSCTNMKYREMELYTHSRKLMIPAGLSVRGGCIAPESFVNYSFVESLFPSVRAFTHHLFKNVEAQVETAIRLGEMPSVPDEELLSIILKICVDEFGESRVRSLNDQQKMMVARKLKTKYSASNQQISRLTALPPRVVDEMFPLSAA